ncbi:MAG: DNA polymerase [Terrimicrobiaceae bacterium]
MNSEALNYSNLAGISPQSTPNKAAETCRGERGRSIQADGVPVAGDTDSGDLSRSENEQNKSGETDALSCEVDSPLARTSQNPTIPEHFTESMAEAADFYHSIGLAIHPCNRYDQGRPGEQGKKPCLKRWMETTAADYTPSLQREYFEGSKAHNIGCVVRRPFVIVDLDSKQDKGASVAAWLETQPALLNVPRERTGGGAHLWFYCHDLPKFVDSRANLLSKNLSAPISDTVTAELIYATNVILSPSRHPSGIFYSWAVTGEIPEISWADLQKIFGFSAPCIAKEQKKSKEKPWWTIYTGDLQTLDIVGLAQEAGLYGDILNADNGSHSASCPWASEHSDSGKAWTPRDTATVIFEGAPGKTPGFKCLHSHCSERNLEHFLGMVETSCPGIVDRHCKSVRVWCAGQRSGDGLRTRTVLPGIGRPDSVFATEIGQTLGRKYAWFRFAENPVVIRESVEKTVASAGLRIHTVRPVEAITEIERHAEVGVLRKDDAGDTIFMPMSMTEASARVLLASLQLRGSLPVIRRVLDVPLPVLVGNQIVYPAPGYDPRFGTFLAADAPELACMDVEEARHLILNDLLADKENGGFCWRDEQSKCHAVARILTPFCRGLMGWSRPPLWIIEANRERCGKDFYAQIACIMFLGRKVVFAPPTKDSDEELRKRITTALMANARMIHFANMKGHIRFAALEAATDNTGVWQDRILGGNAEACLPNEADFSFSANAGTTWEPDIEGRSRRIALHYEKEEINARTFRHSDLHEWVTENRSALLSALAAFVAEWDRQGRPAGPSPFSSFPQWARVVGGIMNACGLGDPCLPHGDASKITGDQNTEAMKLLFVMANERFDNDFIKKADLVEFIVDHQDGGLLEWLDLKSRSGLTSLGKLLNKYESRELGGIRLSMPPGTKNNAQYRFFRSETTLPEGTSGTSGTSSPATYGDKNKQLPAVMGEEDMLYGALVEVPHVPDVPPPIESAVELGRIAEEIALAESPLALNIETYNQERGGGALSPFTAGAQIRLLTLAVPGRPPWVIDLRAVGYDLCELGGVIEGGEVIGHNLKFDLLWLNDKCGILPRRIFCTMTASRLLTAGSKDPNDLGAVIARHLGMRMPKEEGRSDWGRMLLTPEKITYSANDVRHLHALRAKLAAAVASADLGDVFALEMSLLPVVVGMEAAGFPVDRETLTCIGADAARTMGGATDQLRQALSEPGLNPSSPGQLKTALHKFGVHVENTSAETLSAIDHDVVRAVLAFREHEKTSQQAQSLLDALSPDGCIHALFEPVGTVTGRFSSKQPNLQNVKRGVMRRAFRAPEGKSLVIADYSQVELRAVASIAGDRVMLEAFRKGEDLHRKTAALVLGKAEVDISNFDRQTAKAVNFGLIYGQSATGLVSYARSAYGVEIDMEDAKRMRDRFFASYRGIAAWHKRAWRKASEAAGAGDCCAYTSTGRRRRMPMGGEDWPRFATLVNTPVQGTCGDGLKEAMVRIDALLPASAKMVATIHDELVIVAPTEICKAVKDIVVEQMIAAMSDLFPDVPIVVDAKVCSTWGEK